MNPVDPQDGQKLPAFLFFGCLGIGILMANVGFYFALFAMAIGAPAPPISEVVLALSPTALTIGCILIATILHTIGRDRLALCFAILSVAIVPVTLKILMSQI